MPYQWMTWYISKWTSTRGRSENLNPFPFSDVGANKSAEGQDWTQQALGAPKLEFLGRGQSSRHNRRRVSPISIERLLGPRPEVHHHGQRGGPSLGFPALFFQTGNIAQNHPSCLNWELSFPFFKDPVNSQSLAFARGNLSFLHFALVANRRAVAVRSSRDLDPQ